MRFFLGILACANLAIVLAAGSQEHNAHEGRLRRRNFGVEENLHGANPPKRLRTRGKLRKRARCKAKNTSQYYSREAETATATSTEASTSEVAQKNVKTKAAAVSQNDQTTEAQEATATDEYSDDSSEEQTTTTSNAQEDTATTTNESAKATTSAASSSGSSGSSSGLETSSGLDLSGTHSANRGTYYNVGLGACGNTSKDSDFIVAPSYLIFNTYPGATGNPNTNPMCGKQIKVNYKGKEVVVTVEDMCPSCATWDLDLSPAAFEVLEDFSVGVLQGMTWSFV